MHKGLSVAWKLNCS